MDGCWRRIYVRNFSNAASLTYLLTHFYSDITHVQISVLSTVTRRDEYTKCSDPDNCAVSCGNRKMSVFHTRGWANILTLMTFTGRTHHGHMPAGLTKI